MMQLGNCTNCIRSSQPRVLRLGLLQDGDARVGVFPEREEILICGAGIGRVALQSVGSEPQMRQVRDGSVCDVREPRIAFRKSRQWSLPSYLTATGPR
jgi:hypothetical protein